MDNPGRGNAYAGREAEDLHARWTGVLSGLRVILLGYGAALLIAGFGVGLIWVSQTRWAHGQQHATFSVDQAARVGWMLVIGGLATSYLTMLVGQRRCLVWAPRRYGSREFLFAGVLCMLLNVGCMIATYLMGAADSDTVIAAGAYPVFLQQFFQGPQILLLMTTILFLFNFLLFSGFLRGVAKSLAPSRKIWVVSLFCTAAFLIGGTMGLVLSPHKEVARWLAIGWGISVLWQMLLVRVSCGWIGHTLNALQRGLGPHRQDQPQRTKPYSGLQRHVVQVRRY